MPYGDGTDLDILTLRCCLSPSISVFVFSLSLTGIFINTLPRCNLFFPAVDGRAVCFEEGSQDVQQLCREWEVLLRF